MMSYAYILSIQDNIYLIQRRKIYILAIKDNISYAPFYLCNDNCDSNRVKNDYPKHAQKAPSLPPSKLK